MYWKLSLPIGKLFATVYGIYEELRFVNINQIFGLSCFIFYINTNKFVIYKFCEGKYML